MNEHVSQPNLPPSQDAEAVFLREEERQTVVLALAHLSVERPGWKDWIKTIVERMKASAMFDEFIDLHNDKFSFFEATVIAKSVPPSSATQGDTKHE